MPCRLIHREDGIGVVTALMVAFIVFTLGASWYAISVHELDEVVFDRHRTGAVHVADAAARDAMRLLSQEPTVRDAAEGSGVYSPGGHGGGTCVLVDLVTESGSEIKGQYWYLISDSTPSDITDYRYFIEAWGWAPARTARQAPVKKVEFEVQLFPTSGFDYALFAAAQGLTGNQQKTIYGDVYAGNDAIISNYTDVFDNGSYPGDGHLEVYGRLEIQNGARTRTDGTVSVNGRIDDLNPTDQFNQDVISVYDNANFQSATIGGEVKLGGVLESPYPGSVNGAPLVENAVGLEPVPQRGLPILDLSRYSTVNVWNHWDNPSDQPNSFLKWYKDNKTSLSGVHHVKDTGAYTLDFRPGATGPTATFADDFALIVEGDLTVSGTADYDPAAAPVTVVIAGNRDPGTKSASDPGSKVTLATGFGSSDNLRFVFYTKGPMAMNQQVTIYGAVYAEGDATGQKFTIHFRPPDEDIVVGFEFSDFPYDVEPGSWREVPELVDTTGIVEDPAAGPSYHCTY